MPLDPQARSFLDRFVLTGAPPRWSLPLKEARRQAEANNELAGPAPDLARVEDRVMPGPGGPLGLRIYTPAGNGPLPALVYFHGGGWVLGSLDSHDNLCRILAHGSGAVVVAVDYRLAPETRFPAAADDAYAATAWVIENSAGLGIDPERVAVGGDSAGGNLAAVTCLMARDRGGPRPVFQLLVYPITGYYEPETLSYRERAEGYSLTRADMVWFWDSYLPGKSEAYHPYAAPIRAASLAGLPPALVITAGYDPLCDEGQAYARRLQEAGVPVKLLHYEGQIHNFFRLGREIDQGKEAVARAVESLREAYGR